MPESLKVWVLPVEPPVLGSARGLTSPVAVKVLVAMISPSVTGVNILDLVRSCHMRARMVSAPVSLASGNLRRSPLRVTLLYFSTWAAHCGNVLGIFSSAGSVWAVVVWPVVALPCAAVAVGACRMEWMPHWRLASSHMWWMMAVATGSSPVAT